MGLRRSIPVCLLILACLDFKAARAGAPAPFGRDNLVAWCIVPFDAKERDPEARAAMLERLGFRHFAYDWRPEHVPTFDAEVDALKRHGVALDAFWVSPGELNDDSRRILDLLRRHGVRAQLWANLSVGPELRVEGPEQERRIERAAAKLGPLAREAARIGCTVGLYNHGGWFGEPENEVAVIERLKGQGIANVGLVYNLHHGHGHLDRFPRLLEQMKPYLLALNLNGMDRDGERHGRKILPLGQGALDLELLRTIVDSGYRGPIGILGHTQDDAEDRLRDNLDGLDWLVAQLDGKSPGPRPQPQPRTPVPPRPQEKAETLPDPDAARVAALIDEAREKGDVRRGAELFLDPKFACNSCHKVGGRGGEVGPDLTAVGLCVPADQVVASVLWPRRQVKEGYAALAVACSDGRLLQGYKQAETAREMILRDATTGASVTVAKDAIEAVREAGSLMPEGLTEAMTAEQRRDLVRFLLGLGRPGDPAAAALHGAGHVPAAFAYDRAPLRPEAWPSWQQFVNRDRVYDFYAKEAAYFARQPEVPSLLPPFPGLDGGKYGHWGNQDEAAWADDRWSQTDLGNVLCGVFRGAGRTVPKGVCVRLGDRGELAACFNPETLCYEAVWEGGFVSVSPVRHGFLDGLRPEGKPLPAPAGKPPEGPFVYHGFYRHGRRILFSYRLGEIEMLDAPWVEDGKFTRVVAPAAEHPLAAWTHGGPAAWPEVFTTRGTRGTTRPFAVDTIEAPFDNPWKAPLFFGDHDFTPDGDALLCTMQGDVWCVSGLDEDLASVRWRRVASGLHQALGLVVADGVAHVLGRDQITRLHDLNGDGEADFYECMSNAYRTSPAGHDFTCGLQRDAQGRFYTVSGKQGVLRISADGRQVEVLATGFRNADGLGLSPDGVVTVPSSEGDWTPASMIAEIRPGGHYGAGGPRDGQTPDLPLVYLPRGLDNSSGAQVFVPPGRWGPLQGQLLHFSHGAGTAFLVLRDRVDGQPQGAAVPLPIEFRSGSHRGRFHPRDGHLYVSGMGGWGTYTVADGSFQRVRYLEQDEGATLPIAMHAHENGVLVTFSRPLEGTFAAEPRSHFAQAWNYRYGAGYGSPEFSTRHPGMPGHDPMAIRAAHVLDDGRSLFLELPDLQPVNQLHLHLGLRPGQALDLFATVHRLAAPFTALPGYRPAAKTIAAHPILADLAGAAAAVPNPWRWRIPNSQPIKVTIEAGTNLSFDTRSFRVPAGAVVSLTFGNPDVVPHNWALVRPDSLSRVGALANALVSEPDAAARQYIPRSDDVLVYTDLVYPQERATIHFRAPREPGRYPYLCTFPGHWMVMNGVMIVE
jgi:putative heme-binding domain-containing protein